MLRERRGGNWLVFCWILVMVVGIFVDEDWRKLMCASVAVFCSRKGLKVDFCGRISNLSVHLPLTLIRSELITVVFPESCGPMTMTLSGSHRSHNALKLLCWWWKVQLVFMSTAANTFWWCGCSDLGNFSRLESNHGVGDPRGIPAAGWKIWSYFLFYVKNILNRKLIYSFPLLKMPRVLQLSLILILRPDDCQK